MLAHTPSSLAISFAQAVLLAQNISSFLHFFTYRIKGAGGSVGGTTFFEPVLRPTVIRASLTAWT